MTFLGGLETRILTDLVSESLVRVVCFDLGFPYLFSFVLFFIVVLFLKEDRDTALKRSVG